MKKQIYFQDEPVKRFIDDKIGFEEEVRMIK